MRPSLMLGLVLVMSCAKRGPVNATSTLTEDVRLTIVGMNDFHASLYEQPIKGVEGKVAGGLPWLVGAVDALRQQDPDLILLDGGDQFQGTWAVNATFGRGSTEAFNLLKVDAAAVGNHEFDYGGQGGGHPLRGALESAGKLAKFHWLAANITEQDGSLWQPEGFAPWTIIERKGVKVGVIGLSTMDTPQVTLAANVADLQFNDIVETMQRTLPEVKAAGAQVITVVAHLTGSCKPKDYVTVPEPCLPDDEIGRLLTELPRGSIDVLVVGHAHTLLAERWDDTFVIEQRSQGHALGIVDLVVGPDGVKTDESVVRAPWFLLHDPVDPGCEAGEYKLDAQQLGAVAVSPSQPALDLVKRLEAEAGSLCDPVGCATALLTRSREAESEVGDLMADAMRAAFPEADAAITNSGGLRADLPAGTLRREHWQRVMPFDNRMVLISMTGAQLETLLRVGSSGAHGLLQVSGISYRYEPNATNTIDLDGDGAAAEWERDRLCEADVRVNGAPIDPARSYQVVTSDFLYGGGDHLGPAFAGTTLVREGDLIRDQLYKWSAAQTECLGTTPVMNEKAPRVHAAACSR